MSFNKYYIPEPGDLATLMKQNGPTHTVSRKIDALIGNPVSIDIFDFAYEMVRKNDSDESVIEALTQKFPDYFNAKSN
jgi:hypothetical protein